MPLSCISQLKFITKQVVSLTEGYDLFMSKKSNIEVSVTGHVDKALRQLKKKIEREGVVRDMKRTVYFEPTTQKRRKRLVRAIKMNMMRMINQGLIKP